MVLATAHLILELFKLTGSALGDSTRILWRGVSELWHLGEVMNKERARDTHKSERLDDLKGVKPQEN